MKFVCLIIISLFLSGCNPKEALIGEHLVQKISDVNVYSNISLYELFDSSNVKLLSKNFKIDTNEVGNVIYNVEYEHEKRKYVTKIKLNIVDKESPRYLGGTNKTVLKNYEGDLCNLIMYGDNYDGNLKCIIEGEYDLSTIGTYNLIYKIFDNSNNTTSINVTLNVIEKSKTSNNNLSTKKTPFEDVYAKHKNDFTEVGIDVSKWQGEIDFEKVKNSGASFVMIRIGVQTKVNGELIIDPYYKQNIKNAKKAGLKVGVYLYSIATSKKEAIEHANWVIKTLNGEKLDLPIVFDWENWSKWNTYKLSFHDINSIANNFMNAVKNNGYEGMLYSSKYYLENIWTNELNFPVWLAHYTSKTNYEGKYKMWQLSNTGRIDGINGDVDINIMYS